MLKLMSNSHIPHRNPGSVSVCISSIACKAHTSAKTVLNNQNNKVIVINYHVCEPKGVSIVRSFGQGIKLKEESHAMLTENKYHWKAHIFLQ